MCKNLTFTLQKYLYIFPITGRLWIYCIGCDFDRTTLQLESDRNWGNRGLMRYRVTFDSRFRVVARRKWQPTEMGCHGRHFGCHWVRTLHLTSGMFYIYILKPYQFVLSKDESIFHRKILKIILNIKSGYRVPTSRLVAIQTIL